jgi:hypothetical protein
MPLIQTAESKRSGAAAQTLDEFGAVVSERECATHTLCDRDHCIAVTRHG